ncbi:hypothetical protein B0J18DRAFT_446954 [Chaetomium sp. MPI-SDFR-AT-0129]|nr:hypothetical protein B0J18DRAFT_446954 [Chaetomium sp. MPI-SDFR-AT-0129]
MARLRLGYTKSRTGCLRCKQRRVKCDETRPSCKACLRHGIECSLSTQTNAHSPGASSTAAGTPPPAPSPQLPPSRRNRTRPINPQPPTSGPPPPDHGPETGPSPSASALTPAVADSPATNTSDPFPYLTKLTNGLPEDDTTDWVPDLELLHHFITSTYSTFLLDPARPETGRLWQVVAPKLAFVHVFLLHQMLAVGGYHLAYLHPENRQAYSLRASQHQNAGIRRMRLALSELSPDNCHALFASSSLLFIGALAASSTNREAATPTIDEVVDVLILVKGVGTVLFSSQDLLRSGPLSALLTQTGCAEQPNPALDRVVLAVGDFLVEIAETETDDRVRAIVHTDAYRLVSAIRESLVKVSGPEYRVVAAWPIQTSDDLIPMLRQRNQAALALLSYYCVVLHAAEMQGYWFMEGWAAGVIQDIAKVMTGPYKKHSAWALGWITGHAVMG